MLTYIKRGIYLVFLGVLFIQLSGCEDGGVTPETQTYTFTVYGNIGSFWGEPKTNLKITVDTNEVYTDADGNFTIPDVEPPYDLNIFDSTKNSYYKLVDVNYDSVKFFTKLPESISNQCNFRVTTTPFPLPNNIKAKYIFTDGKYLNAYGEAKSSSSGYEIVRLRNYSSVNGRLILIGYKTDQNGRVISYENFGEKVATLTSGGISTVNFDTSEISFNPNEATITGNFTNGTGSTNFGLVTLSFGRYHTPNYATPISFGEFNSSSNFSYIIPTDLPGLLKIRIYFESLGPQITTQKIWVAIDPNSQGGAFTLKDKPNLIEPAEGSLVDNSTLFKFSTGADADIYIINISQGNNQYYLYTKKTEFTLVDFTSLGFNPSSGQTYNWKVTKIGEYYNVTNFIVNPAPLSSYESVSETRTFISQ